MSNTTKWPKGHLRKKISLHDSELYMKVDEVRQDFFLSIAV